MIADQFLLQGKKMGYNRWYNYEDIQMGPCIISWLGNLMLIVKKVIMLFYFIWINYQKKRSKSAKLNKENDSIKKESSFISLSGEDSNTSETVPPYFFLNLCYFYIDETFENEFWTLL